MGYTSEIEKSIDQNPEKWKTSYKPDKNDLNFYYLTHENGLQVMLAIDEYNFDGWYSGTIFLTNGGQVELNDSAVIALYDKYKTLIMRKELA